MLREWLITSQTLLDAFDILLYIKAMIIVLLGLPRWGRDKESACQCRRHKRNTGLISKGRKDPLEQEMATPSSILAWEIPWSEEPSGLQSMRSQRVRHNRARAHTMMLLMGHVSCRNRETASISAGKVCYK